MKKLHTSDLLKTNAFFIKHKGKVTTHVQSCIPSANNSMCTLSKLCLSQLSILIFPCK